MVAYVAKRRAPGSTRLCLSVATSAICLLGGLGPTTAHAVPIQQDEPAAEATGDAPGLPSDAAIQSRLERVFASSDEWSGVSVFVEGGVVSLEGEVVRAEAADEAVEVARATEGVVFVQNRVETARDLRRALRGALDRLSDRFYDAIGLLPLLLIAGAIFGGFVLVSKVASERVQRSRRVSRNRFVRDIARQAVRLVIIVLGLWVVLDLLDATAAVSALLGTAGILGLALGFAFRDLVENYIASILLSLRHPFAPNDHVVVDGEEGHVVRLTSRATILLTPDGNHLRIPNASVFKANILNYTRNALRRFDFDVGIGTEEELPQALAVGVDAMKGVEGVLEEPNVLAIVRAFGDSTVQLRFHGWMDQTGHDFLKVRSAAMSAVKDAFDEAGIEMPEPIYRVQTISPQEKTTPARAPRRASTPVDVSADHELGRQVSTERAQGEEDLLADHAPLE